MTLPTGIIAIWSGSAASIPAGWTLCDGSPGTPDLRDKFVVGAGGAYAVDAQGGAATHTHTFTTDGHFHTFAAGAAIAAGDDLKDETWPNTDTGTTDAGSSLPPYYALCYIIKL